MTGPRGGTSSRRGRAERLKLDHRVSETEDGERLDAVLAGFLPAALERAVPRSALRRWIMGGAVSVSGRPLRRPGMPVRTGTRLEVRLRPEALRASGVAGDRDVTIGEDRVLFEDDVLIAIDKPPGLPTQPTVDPRRPSLYRLVKDLLGKRGGSGEPYLGLHQRLDRDTSGVVLFTKAPGVNPAVAALFAERGIEKTYRALCARPARLPPPEWSVEGRLDVSGRGRERRPHPVAVGGVRARTDFRLLEVLPAGVYVEARPITGKKHQIRVHLATGGMPILGDRLHGGPGAAKGAPRPMLHASRLAFRHPLSGRRVVVQSPLPMDFTEALRAALEARPGSGSTGAANPAGRGPGRRPC